MQLYMAASAVSQPSGVQNLKGAAKALCVCHQGNMPHWGVLLGVSAVTQSSTSQGSPLALLGGLMLTLSPLKEQGWGEGRLGSRYLRET